MLSTYRFAAIELSNLFPNKNVGIASSPKYRTVSNMLRQVKYK